MRAYFDRQGVLEVKTPLLREAGASDPHLVNLAVELSGREAYLQTSPEAAMKRLLAEHGRSIYQICSAFRGAESGRLHSIEFTMLEWYRCDMSLEALMDDLTRFLTDLIEALGDSYPLALTSVEPLRVSYRTIFEQAFDLNPHQATPGALAALCRHAGIRHLVDPVPADYLDALFATVIEPALTAPTIVYDYPVSQAALAESRPGEAGDRVAARFELYLSGIEIANAYQELRNGEELAKRLASNNSRRMRLGLPVMIDDLELIAATAGLPACSGIALGLDRLAMVLLGRDQLAEVIG